MCRERYHFLVSTDLGQKNRSPSPVLSSIEPLENYNGANKCILGADLSSFSAEEHLCHIDTVCNLGSAGSTDVDM